MKKKPDQSQRSLGTSSLKDAIGDMLSDYRIQRKFDQTQLVVSWEKIMGKPIASRTRKIYFKDQTMFVVLNSAPLKNELMHSKEKVLKLLSEEFGPGVVNDVVFM